MKLRINWQYFYLASVLSWSNAHCSEVIAYRYMTLDFGGNSLSHVSISLDPAITNALNLSLVTMINAA